MTTTEDFFEEQSEASRVKSDIVSNYFLAWANVMVGNARRWRLTHIRYRELYAGPGTYKDGTKSTPILVLDAVAKTPKFLNFVLVQLNEGDPERAKRLHAAIADVSGIQAVDHKPIVTMREIESEEDIADIENERLPPPTLFFVDPFGYRGLTLRLLRACTKGRGSDLIFFFNYRRINAAIDNELFWPRMVALFGRERFGALRTRLAGLPPYKREEQVLGELQDLLRKQCGNHVLKFPCGTEDGSQTSHYLMFVTKNPKGQTIMKNIMAARSASRDGKLGLGFDPVARRGQGVLFEDPTGEVPKLQQMLLTTFAGKQITFADLFRQHQAGTEYAERFYRNAILKLEARGEIVLRPPASARKRGGKVTLPGGTLLSFPKGPTDV